MKGYLDILELSAGYYGKMILNNISFSVNKCEVLSVIGQNGCGKSTLLKTIARVISDNKGDIIFNNIKLNNKKTWDLKKEGISWFVQGGLVFPTMKVSEHFELALKGKSKIEVNHIKDECISYFPSLATIMDMRGGNLSGGERQKLSFAMLLSQQTQFWLLDEPTAGLSPQAVNEALLFLTKMKYEKQVSMLLVEHNYPFAFELADRVGIIKDGKWTKSYLKSEFIESDFLEMHLYN